MDCENKTPFTPHVVFSSTMDPLSRKLFPEVTDVFFVEQQFVFFLFKKL